MSDSARHSRTAILVTLVLLGLLSLASGTPKNKMVGNPIRLQEIQSNNASWTPYKPEEHPPTEAKTLFHRHPANNPTKGTNGSVPDIKAALEMLNDLLANTEGAKAFVDDQQRVRVEVRTIL